MGSFSILHWIVIILVILPNLLFLPAVRRSGYSAGWVFLSMIPLVGLALLWIWAFAKWPAQPER